MKIKSLTVVLLAVLLVFFGCGKNGTTTGSIGGSTTGGVTGTVSDGVSAIPGVLVQLLGSSSQVYTDANGQYAIGNIPANLQTLRFSKNGYTSADQQVSVLPGLVITANQIMNLSNPVLLFIDPGSGVMGTRVTIAGTGFGVIQGTVRFNRAVAPIYSWNEVQIVAQAPAASTGWLEVEAAGVASPHNLAFTYLVPVLTSLTPNSGSAGAQITIAGTNFGTFQGTSRVSFTGADASVFASWCDTQAVVTVPGGVEAGNLTLTSCGGASNGLPFTVAP